MRIAPGLPVLLGAVLVAGCLAPADQTDATDLDRPLGAVASAYYDVSIDQLVGERSVRHLGGGPTSGSLRFHPLADTETHLRELNETYPGLVDLQPLATTREGRTVWQVIVTDESVPAAGKVAPVLDGAHHGNEYAGGELMLYTLDLLLQNHATNATVRSLLRDVEIHAVPVVNPDGWEAATRYNGFGVNLNRNYDVDWGNPLGTSNPVMGTAGAVAGRPVGGVALAAENCGEAPFSEPETAALRDLFASLGDRAAVYLTGHTATHAVIAPWAAFQQPAELPGEHSAVLETELQWVRDHTEYQAGKAQWGNLSAGLPYAASGSSMDYFYTTLGKPAFTIEVEYEVTSATSPDYPMRLTQPFEGLRYWMEASVPLPLHLLLNARSLSQWEQPTMGLELPASMEHPELRPATPQAHL
ncbi:MAG TPA: M14 family zinc carboxypeptidase [Candidatus Thermoplasmatota archaeon]|nr:M14 family zinc carboxypeptidase [Candidatus Thermoplasmatota archaeon]